MSSVASSVASAKESVEIGEGVTQVGKNALAALADTVTVLGKPLLTYRKPKAETTINGMPLATYNKDVRFLNVGEEWNEASPASAEPVISEGMVLVSKTELEAAGAATLTIVDGTAYVGIVVRTNGDLTAKTKSWGRVKFADTTKVGLSEDGTEIVIPVPANAEKGFMVLESKATEK